MELWENPDLGSLPDWKLERGRLVRTYPFEGFLDGLSFVNAIAWLAEAMNHHPDVQLCWGSVRIELWTHDANGLTRLDRELAERIEALFRA